MYYTPLYLYVLLNRRYYGIWFFIFFIRIDYKQLLGYLFFEKVIVQKWIFDRRLKGINKICEE
jgi:hypothetical protein